MPRRPRGVQLEDLASGHPPRPLDAAHLPAYLDATVFRHNRRRAPMAALPSAASVGMRFTRPIARRLVSRAPRALSGSLGWRGDDGPEQVAPHGVERPC